MPFIFHPRVFFFQNRIDAMESTGYPLLVFICRVMGKMWTSEAMFPPFQERCPIYRHRCGFFALSPSEDCSQKGSSPSNVTNTAFGIASVCRLSAQPASRTRIALQLPSGCCTLSLGLCYHIRISGQIITMEDHGCRWHPRLALQARQGVLRGKQDKGQGKHVLQLRCQQDSWLNDARLLRSSG